MKLKGVLDFSLGNFLCLRGFAPMGVLQDTSTSDASYQRVTGDERLEQIAAFLRAGEFLFFPEIILCATLSAVADESADVALLYENVQTGKPCSALKFDGFHLSSSVNRARAKGAGDIRAVQVFQTATLDVASDPGFKFSRIDGNHRLEAAPRETAVGVRNTPFCLLLFRDRAETRRLSRALFHNINYKQLPLTMEQNLRLILGDEELFPDGDLKDNPSFGWSYYLARRTHARLDFELLANLEPFIAAEPRTFLVEQFASLIYGQVLGENENAVSRFKSALVDVNALFNRHAALKASTNPGLLAALIYYNLRSPAAVSSFVRWVLENHLHHIERTGARDLIQIFDKVLASRKRTIFISMPFGKPETENHCKIVQRICDELSETHELKPALKLERVDWFHDGTSYDINDKIIEMMSDCGLLIGNLTFCNPNVYHEIGFIMGKAKAEGRDAANMLLFLDESIADDKARFVAFNLRGIKQLRFTQTEDFSADLRENIERFFKLK